MGGRGLVMLLVLPACGAHLADTGDDQPLTTDSGGDSDGDVGPLPDAPGTLPPWGTPSKITPAATVAGNEDDGVMRDDVLEFIFAVQDPDDTAAPNSKHLFTTSRATVNDAWGAATKITTIDMVGVTNETPRFDDNGLTLYFSSTRTGGPGSQDIYKSTRDTLTSPWKAPTVLPGGANSAMLEKTYTPCGGKYLVVRAGDIFEGTVGAAPVLADNLNDATTSETGPWLAENCLRVYFTSPRDGTTKLYTATRATMADPWGAPAIFDEFASVPGAHEDPWISSDGRTFVFAAKIDAATTKDEYIVTR